MLTLFPLPFECQHEHYLAGAEDDHGNVTPTWNPPEHRECFWWPGPASEASPVAGGSEQATVDRTLILDIDVPVDHRDRFMFGAQRFEAAGLPKEFDHGPFGFVTDRQVVELRFVG